LLHTLPLAAWALWVRHCGFRLCGFRLCGFRHCGFRHCGFRHCWIRLLGLRLLGFRLVLPIACVVMHPRVVLPDRAVCLPTFCHLL
jgi:hypothetical protein